MLFNVGTLAHVGITVDGKSLVDKRTQFIKIVKIGEHLGANSLHHSCISALEDRPSRCSGNRIGNLQAKPAQRKACKFTIQLGATAHGDRPG